MQTFGDLVTFNPHIHALVADGVFLPSCTFRVWVQPRFAVHLRFGLFFELDEIVENFRNVAVAHAGIEGGLEVG